MTDTPQSRQAAIEIALRRVLWGRLSDAEMFAEVAERAVQEWEAVQVETHGAFKWPTVSAYGDVVTLCGNNEPHAPHGFGGSCNDYFQCDGVGGSE